ncbi:MAG TPA: site-specific integrase [Chryseosolibacter sp.]|nr:site-specific integrase [Chryseosolibacter sp.]
MKVFLRDKKISGGRKTLYLDFYPPIIHPVTGKATRREFLKLYVYEKPKCEADRDHNKETKILAENVRAQRQIFTQAGNFGFLLENHRKKDFLQYFRDQAEKRKISQGNYDNWLSSYNYFNDFTKGKCLMEDVTEKLIGAFKEHLLTTTSFKNTKSKKRLSQNAAHSYFNKFKAAVKRAFEEKYLDDDHGKRVKAIQQAETEREFLTIEELNTLAKTECELPDLKRMALFSALTGLRWSDIVKLRWNELQHTGGNGYFIQYTQQKTKGAEILPISDQAFSLLGERLAPTDLVFPNLEYSAWLNSKIKDWVTSAGIHKKITFHNFRHTYATLQLTAGTDIYTVSKLLGHKQVKTTAIYAKVVDKKKIEAATKIKIDF